MPIETMINEKMYLQSIASLCQTDGAEGQTVYGLQIVCSDEVVFQAGDISSNEIDVLKLISLIKGQSVGIAQLQEIIEDYVDSLYI
jgi:hypothetical protein